MGRTWSDEGPKCPYCEDLQVPDEPFYYDESTTTLDCGNCGKEFNVEVYHSVSWSTSKKEDGDGTGH